MSKTALVIAMVMVVGMSVTAFAATNTEKGSGNFTVTINPDSTDEATHEYEAYQIFKGDLLIDGNTKTLSNIEWGNGVSTSGLIADINTALGLTGENAIAADATAADVAKKIGDMNLGFDAATTQALAAAFAKHLDTAIEGTATGVEGLKAGYYLIKDVDDSLEDAENGAYTRYILQVSDSVTVNEKAAVPSVVKKVLDVNDSETVAADANYRDTADYDIGDDVPFRLTATLSSKVSDYVKYHITFQDNLSDGLDAPDEYTITVLGHEFTLAANATSGQEWTDTTNGVKVTVENATAESGQDFAIKVSFESTTSGAKLPAALNGASVVVDYTAELNDDAVIGSEGNPNTVYLKYSNDANSTDGSEEAKTPTDTNIVFTYKVVINKIKADETALEGAGFTLYKQTGSTTSEDEDGNEVVTPTWTQIGDELTGGTTFTFSGLDDGIYKLVESTTPNGYNTIEDQIFKVSATHTNDADGDLKLTDLTGTVTTGEITFTKDVDEGSLTSNVVNQSGTVLPSTGGMGTTIFYIVGAILVVGAGVILITRRRMRAE